MNKLSTLISIPVVALACSLSIGCNTFEPLDSPSSQEEILEQGRYEADNGDCVTSRDRLTSLFPKDDEILFSQGFSELCVGGATLEYIGKTVATYTSTAGADYIVVGRLARLILPWSQGKQNNIYNALGSFQQIQAPTRRAYSTLIGHLTKLAILTAKASGGRSVLIRDDISTEANCTSIAACTAGGMSDADAAEFRSIVSQMATDVQSLELQGLKDLAAALNTSFGALSDAATRYTVRTSVVPAD